MTIVNETRPTQCAEEDNVYVKLVGADIRRLTITAVHPRYIDEMSVDRTAPDFTHCDMSNDPGYGFTPRTVTLFDDGSLRLIGHTYASFWRPEVVPFTINERRIDGLHLIQVFHRSDRGWVEFLVLYPSDGYWRVKPLPPGDLRDTAYGSSFLIGPIEERGRPMVVLEGIRFRPTDRTFELAFTQNRRGSLSIREIAPQGTVLDIDLEFPTPEGQPFAALRSMFVTESVADVAVAQWRSHGSSAWQTATIAELSVEPATEVRFGRQEPSGHNTSAPDLIFRPSTSAR